MDMCQQMDPDISEGKFFCTLEVGHDAGAATITHRCDYMETNPEGPPPFFIPAVREWTVTAG